MRPQDIVIGEVYRLREHPDYSYLRADRILKPGEGVNTHSYIIVECRHSVYKDDKAGLTRYYRPVDMVKDK